jgi:hypothetical protein
MTVSLLPSDADARGHSRRLDATLVVEAAADRQDDELVSRILRVLEAGLTTMEQIVAVRSRRRRPANSSCACAKRSRPRDEGRRLAALAAMADRCDSSTPPSSASRKRT